MTSYCKKIGRSLMDGLVMETPRKDLNRSVCLRQECECTARLIINENPLNCVFPNESSKVVWIFFKSLTAERKKVVIIR